MSAPPVSYGASEVPPRPVTPAGTIPDHTPAKALDELVGEPSALEKAMEMGKTVSAVIERMCFVLGCFVMFQCKVIMS